MTKKYDNNMHGALWINGNDTEGAPKWTGECEINNQKFRIAMWPTDADETSRMPSYKLRFEVAKK